ncbi:MAG: DinB family protein [Bacteroidota bacterium]
MDFSTLFLREIKRRLFEESFARLRQCLSMLTEEETWYRPNENSNSVGNLTLHLMGNTKQWILSGLGKEPDTRTRQQEFDERGPIPTTVLLDQLDKLEKKLDACISSLQPESLTAIHDVQVYKEHGISILVHVVEHFSYHVGQITYYVKARKNVDTQYYGDQDLG